jgi:hypothetical protein
MILRQSCHHFSTGSISPPPWHHAYDKFFTRLSSRTICAITPQSTEVTVYNHLTDLESRGRYFDNVPA